MAKTKKNPVAVDEVTDELQLKNKSLSLFALVEKDERNFWVTIPDLRNARVKGRTKRDAIENAKNLLEVLFSYHLSDAHIEDLEYLSSMSFFNLEVFTTTIDKMNFEFSVLIREDTESGTFVAQVPALNGCITQGDSQKELEKNITEVIDLCIESQLDRKPIEEIPNLTYVSHKKLEVYLS